MRSDSVRGAMVRVLAVLAILAGAVAAGAYAQGVTSASLRGHVLDEAGSPIEGALVTATNVATGLRYQARSRSGGAFNIENVALGRFTLEARAIGYRPTRIEGTRVALGQVAEAMTGYIDKEVGHRQVVLRYQATGRVMRAISPPTARGSRSNRRKRPR